MPQQLLVLPKPLTGYLGCLLLLSLLLLSGLSSCRTVAKRQYKEVGGNTEVDGTYNTTKDAYYKFDKKMERIYTPIYTIRTNHYLVGNECMREFTRSMGFEYMPYDEYPHETYGPVGYHFYNITSRIGMIFKKGPFWKSKVNKRLAECRRASGDFIGLNMGQLADNPVVF